MSKRNYLDEISIRNLGIIEESLLEFGPGLNVLTGETGAGKTMILTALGLVLGEKSDSSLVRHGSERLVAGAVFSTPEPSQECRDILQEADIEIESEIIISRSVTAEGKSKATLNGTTVTATLLADVTQQLIEIHGQSANQHIVKSTKQREILDRFGDATISQALTEYQSSFDSYADIKKRITSMKSAHATRDKEVANLEDLLQQWNALKATRGECESVNDEISRLSSVEDLRTASTIASSALNDEEQGSLTSLSTAMHALTAAQGRDSHLDSILEKVKEGLFLITDAASESARYLEKLEADPARLNFLQERKATLNTFIKKWGSGGDPDEELILIAQRVKSAKVDIEDLKGGENRIAELEKELASIKSELLARAKKLTAVRVSTAKELSSLVTQEVAQLSMPHTTLTVDVEAPDYEGALKESDFTNLGCDEVMMSIQSHVDAPKVALGKGVSGGEMSRIMLALSVVIAAHYPVATYIFDEVDAGVGGKAAIEVGRRLHLLSQQSQVIVVTHLPQVAAWADTHFKVEKSSNGVVVASGVAKLSEDERVEEIARMLAGLEESASAREHAAELLQMRSQR